MRRSALCVLTAGILLQGTALSGERTSIQGLGMARTYAGVARGLDAVGLNPANLDADSATVSFSLLPFGFHAGSDFLTYGLYTRYFTGVPAGDERTAYHLADVDKQTILGAFPGSVGRIGVDVEARPLGLGIHLGIGTLGLTVTEQASAMARVPDAYVRFLLYGNTPGSQYDFHETAAQASWTREYAVSLATTFPGVTGLSSLSAGVSVKVIHGFGYAELTQFNTRLETGTDGNLHGVVGMHSRSAGIDLFNGSDKGSFSPFPAPAGSGLGIDLGIAAQVTRSIRAGLSVTDIGSIEWTRNTREALAETTVVVDNPLDDGQRDGLDRALQGKSRETEGFTTGLPTALRAGVAMDLDDYVPGDMTLGCDIDQILRSTTAVSGTRVSLGMEWRPWGFLPLRTGVSLGGPDHSNFALGFGLHLGFFELDLASENLGWLFSPERFSCGSVSAGMKLRF